MNKKQKRERAIARREEFLKEKARRSLVAVAGVLGDRLRTPIQWEVISGIIVEDPDGWRGDDAKSWDEPITLQEWSRRVSMSTFHYVKNSSGRV